MALLAGLLFLSLAVNALLLRQLRIEYARGLAARVWPAGPEPVVQMRSSNPVATPTVLLLGDSRIFDWGTPSLPGWTVANAGVHGMTTAQLAFHTPAVLDRTRPAVAVIQVGINDLKLLGPEPHLYESVVSTCVSNILSVVEECRRRGTHVVVTPVWPVGEVQLARRIVWSSSVVRAMDETNRRMEQALAGRPDVHVTNVFAPLADKLSDSQRLNLYRDTLHLKPESYVRLTAILAGVLATNRFTDSAGVYLQR